MKSAADETAEERLYLKALEIQHERRIGLSLPIMWHLALRGHAGAMIAIADWYCGNHDLKSFGTPANPFSPAGLYYRACTKGEPGAAYNAAMSCFNRNDLIGYRNWLRRALLAGDVMAGKQLRQFETRLPHTDTRKIGRLRPNQKRDEYA